jgi:Ig-like domain from next to BRCA1 gene/SdrD B-like domain
MHRSTTSAILSACAALACAALACSAPLDETLITPSATSTVAPSPVISLPTATAVTPSATIAPAATTIVQPTTVLGPTPTARPGCSNDAQFIPDVTIPDGTAIVPGMSFDKTWQIKNTGTCAWNGSYRLTQISNTSVQAVSKDIPLPPVEPGTTVEIGLKATLSADTPPGAKSVGQFALLDPTGKQFGTKLTIVVIAVLPGTQQGSAQGTLKGSIWLDYCHPGNAEGAVGPDLGTCLTAPNGTKAADGIFEPDEKGIAGVSVQLLNGACTGPLVASVKTDAKGLYTFTQLSAGQYCVSVNALDVANASILIPGGWTHPQTSDSTATIDVTLSPDNLSASQINFGWDFQLD